MLMTALMPVLSRAYAPGKTANATLMEICSAMGTRYVKSPGSDTSDQPVSVMDDCPYCRVHVEVPVLPPAPLPVPQFAILPERPSLFYHAPTPLHAWTVANPRGPPVA